MIHPGGSLIKLVYFSMSSTDGGDPAGGKLHFVKFETSKVQECIDFIRAKGLQRSGDGDEPIRVKATGGGAFKYSDVGWGGVEAERVGMLWRRRIPSRRKPQARTTVILSSSLQPSSQIFKEQLGLILEREDEMGCSVDGCNFLLKAVRHEAYRYANQQIEFEDINPGMFPYLLVTIGSGVSMIPVDGANRYTRVSGAW